MLYNHKTTKLIIGIVGIYSCFFMSSLLNQKIIKSPYSSCYDQHKQSHFTYPIIFLVLPTLFSWLIGCAINSFYKVNTQIPSKYIIKAALTVAIAHYTFQSALLYVDFPLMILVKSCNVLSVVIVGVFFSRVKKESEHKLKKDKLVVGCCIAFGVALFYLSEDHRDSNKSQNHNIIFGLGLLLISVIADGFMPDFLAEIKEQYHPRPFEMYQKINKLVFILSVIFLIVTHQLIPISDFAKQHPAFLIDIVSDSVVTSLGQAFIYYLVYHFRQHVVPLIVSTRKILSGIASIVIFKHRVNHIQWLALLFIGLGTLYQIITEALGRKWKVFRSRKYTVI